jgi:hypothetical protein
MFDAFDTTPQVPLLQRWFAPDVWSGESYLRARWLFLRALGAIFFSAFLALWFQIRGLIGPQGILPANEFLKLARQVLGLRAFWVAPTLLWINASDAMLTATVALGLIASVALILNIWPRMSIAVAGICFLSFLAAAQDFAAYQSDGMLMEAAFLSLFFAPRGIRPGLGIYRGMVQPPSRAGLFLLRYEWFRIYFESGLVKLLSGEKQWRDFSAMDKYYENGPLPTWLGWYVQQWPHRFHAFTAIATLVIELLVCWLIFFGRPGRIIAFAITTPLQIGIILTANYAFLNYLVLALGILLLDDKVLQRGAGVSPARSPEPRAAEAPAPRWAAAILTLHFITTTLMFFFPRFPTAVLLGQTRIANSFGLFAVMTRGRYEIEFQGTTDGKTWVPYPFRYKPQDPMKRPGIYAPYQPRLDWNLWFASLGEYEENRWVMNTQARLLEGSTPVLRLLAGNPFAKKPPIAVRSVIYQYWFTTKGQPGWWRRELKGRYAPTAVRGADGTISFE